MSIYIVDDLVTYNSEDGILRSLQNDENQLALTTTTARLFNLLLENYGCVVSREELFEKIWENHGQCSSNAGLNQYIRTLRKCLYEFGVAENSIITIPKVGFKLNPSIIQRIEDADDSYQDKHEKESQSEKSDAVPIKKHQTNHEEKYETKNIQATPNDKNGHDTQKRCVFYSLLILFIGNVLLFVFSFSNQIKSETVHSYLLTTIDSCRVYTLHPNSEQAIPIKKKIFETAITRSKLSCITGTEFYTYIDDSLVFGRIGDIFIARCTLRDASTNQFIACDSSYYSPWDTK
ncbi:winged helix-turn-helix domain-containing protein [Hafnia paralvei]|uniref:winged helix-turn-helix domain-containing protein n=1 Tax=Hafnia paralvei TaxID=546367 RepID=UPI0029D76E71|nr:winged helix-turn-helix domain-containing protein [Hafnia paralvei]MDX6911670.1 winged helix-turn-helix domain-containing protein [Hafnia paralvei]